MNTEFENMALLNIEDYNELKAKAEATADIWVEYTEPEQRGRLFNLMNKRNENSF